MKDIAAEVSVMMIAALEAGTVPWSRPWSTNGLATCNASTGKAYRGINSVILPLVQAAQGFTDPRWLTFKQAQALGGRVRKGEHGTGIIFWKMLDTTDSDGNARRLPLLRTYTVFNADQCDGLSLPVLPGLVAGWSSPDTLAALDSLLSGYVDGPRVVHSAQGRAFYSPTLDTVTLPPVGAFASPSGYAGTLLHEITHSTGHASRLDRFKDGGAPARFGDPVYAFEELIAELGAVMLGQVAGVAVDVPQSAAYVGGWLGALRGDRGMIIKAAQAAQRASDRVTGAVLAQVTVEADALATV